MIEVIVKDKLVGYLDFNPPTDTTKVFIPIRGISQFYYLEFPYIFKNNNLIAIAVSDKDLKYFERLKNYKAVKDFS